MRDTLEEERGGKTGTSVSLGESPGQKEGMQNFMTKRPSAGYDGERRFGETRLRKRRGGRRSGKKNPQIIHYQHFRLRKEGSEV